METTFLERASQIFSTNVNKRKEQQEDVSVLYEQIGRLKMDIEFLKKVIEKPSCARVKLVEREHPSISVSHQCDDLLDVCRSSLYYKPIGQ
ncbi:hypothetical protein [Emticicia sp. W12TSBA100-4]|uniref:hypothetical protein n=1 Tax=Emticicia sp. W12TSBA100-4 TaxID=3160965 RepID=UPI0033064803